ncbi:exopolysaccharide biosynthesis protein [Rickettsiales bacterium]|nr:exopolysaccharide biosynthesis protein [Rickettsiales bacterium]
MTEPLADIPRTLSEVLKDTLDELEEERIRFQKISDVLGTQAYGAFIVLLTLPNFIPGLSIVSGAFLLVFSIQMALGIQRPWLPKFIGNIRIKKEMLEKGVNLALPYLARIENCIKPRLIVFSTHIAVRLMGLVVTFLSFIVLLPLPFSNLMPSFVLLFMAFGMLQKDGATTLISAVLGVSYSIGFLWVVWGILLKIISVV